MPRCLGLIGLTLALAACGPDPPTRPNVVLISIDTLRADHMGIYGYERSTTPRLDALAAESLVFERAYSSASHTLPAHASLLTGVEPYHHGVLTSDNVLPGEVATLAEILRAAGYRTAAFVNAGYLHEKFGLARGFEVYDFAHNQEPRGSSRDARFGRNADETNEAIERWLDAPRDRPFFLFAHYYDVHSDWGALPYESPPEVRARFETNTPRTGRLDPGERSASAHLERLNREGATLTAPERAWLRSLYDAGIAYTDERVGALIDRLEAQGLLANTLLIVTSDHGEEFQEHGHLLHEQIFEELVHVPLIVKLPEDTRAAGPRASRVAALVRHVDVLPSVLAWAGLDVPDGLAGRSLLPLIAGRETRPRVAVLRNQRATQVGVIEGDSKLLLDRTRDRALLFDLARDPGEESDRSRGSAAEIQRLRNARRNHLLQAPPPTSTEVIPVDPEIAESLRALGYAEEERGRSPAGD